MNSNTAAPAGPASFSRWAKPPQVLQQAIGQSKSELQHMVSTLGAITPEKQQVVQATVDFKSREPECSRILRLRDVMRLVGMGRSSIYSAISRGEFPRQVLLSRRCVGWRTRDIEAWLNSRENIS